MQHVLLVGLTSEQCGYQCGLEKKTQILKNIYIIFIIMRACLHVCMHTLGELGGQKRVLDALELELETVVSYHVSAKNRTRVPYKSNK